MATDVSLGHEGRVFVAGYLPGNNQVQVRIYDQAGTELQIVEVTDPAITLQPSDVFLDVGVRTVTENNNRVNRYEIAVAFSSDQTEPGAPVGRSDAVRALFL